MYVGPGEILQTEMNCSAGMFSITLSLRGASMGFNYGYDLLQLVFILQAGYTKVNKSIRSSNQMPTGASYELFKTIADFDVVASQLGDNVVHQSNQILRTELSTVKLKRYVACSHHRSLSMCS